MDTARVVPGLRGHARGHQPCSRDGTADALR